jgi:hypothetical protein
MKRPKAAYKKSTPRPAKHPYVLPNDPRFGSPSVVRVPFQATQFLEEPDLSPEEEQVFADMVNATDKYEAAVALQPGAAYANPVAETNPDLGREKEPDLDPEAE